MPMFQRRARTSSGIGTTAVTSSKFMKMPIDSVTAHKTANVIPLNRWMLPPRQRGSNREKSKGSLRSFCFQYVRLREVHWRYNQKDHNQDTCRASGHRLSHQIRTE